MKQFTGQVIANYYVAEGYYEMKFLWDKSAGIPQPGQFFTIRISTQTDPLLRRPFAFAGFHASTSSAAVIYQVRGKGTEILLHTPPDTEIDLAGPFGNAFTQPDDGQPNMVLAGGIGLGPMLYLAQALQQQQQPVQFIYGCRNLDLIPGHKGFHSLNPVICTDDGSEGFGGTVVDYLQAQADTLAAGTRLYACGPLAMMRGCHQFALEHDLSCLVSMEAMMACGVGACAGCVVKTVAAPGYARVCKEGAVFDSRELVWD